MSTIATHTGRSRPLLTRIATGVAVATMAAGLAACSSGTAAESSSATESSASTTPLTLQSAWINDGEFMGFYVAQDNGYYSDEGVDLTYVPGGPDVSPESQLLTGKADIALTTPDATAKAISEQGAKFKIVGALFQQSPLGILSLADGANITKPKDLIGKTIAAGTGATVAIQSMLKANGIPLKDVKIVPYSFDPQVILSGEVDGAAEFCPDTPYVIEQKGGKPVCTLLSDLGYTMYNDTVVVTEDALKNNRDGIIGFLKASRKGWEENFKDPKHYPPLFADTWFAGTGREVDHEIYYNEHSEPMMAQAQGYFTMTDADVKKVIAQLKASGIDASADMFDTSLMAEVNGS